MTAVGALPSYPAERWTPPDIDLGLLLEKLQQWQPFAGDAFLDDVTAILEDSPAEDVVEDLMERMRGYSMGLVDIALTHAPQNDTTTELIAQARAVRSEESPGDYRQAVGFLRRMASIFLALFEYLVATKCVREAA
ncbi:DUF6415 family natural product biosynthesis protein [Streptomyces collinus]|uniref:DUF6415 family natural product biosynthesis protein n=1 Tax=Streptomyces collinus TaxID=42684 RepID=UPI0033F83FD9